MSGHVGSAIFESDIVENVGIAVGIASLTLSVHLLIPLPVSTSDSVAEILGFRCWPVASPALSAQMLFLLPVFTSGFHFRFRGRHFVFPMSADVGLRMRRHI